LDGALSARRERANPVPSALSDAPRYASPRKAVASRSKSGLEELCKTPIPVTAKPVFLAGDPRRADGSSLKYFREGIKHSFPKHSLVPT